MAALATLVQLTATLMPVFLDPERPTNLVISPTSVFNMAFSFRRAFNSRRVGPDDAFAESHVDRRLMDAMFLGGLRHRNAIIFDALEYLLLDLRSDAAGCTHMGGN